MIVGGLILTVVAKKQQYLALQFWNTFPGCKICLPRYLAKLYKKTGDEKVIFLPLVIRIHHNLIFVGNCFHLHINEIKLHERTKGG